MASLKHVPNGSHDHPQHAAFRQDFGCFRLALDPLHERESQHWINHILYSWKTVRRCHPTRAVLLVELSQLVESEVWIQGTHCLLPLQKLFCRWRDCFWLRTSCCVWGTTIRHLLFPDKVLARDEREHEREITWKVGRWNGWWRLGIRKRWITSSRPFTLIFVWLFVKF